MKSKFFKMFLIFSIVFTFFGTVMVSAAPPPDKYKDLSKYPQMLKDWYKKRTGGWINLENPQNYHEKIQWLKLWDSTPIKNKLSDKYLVKDYDRQKIGEKYVVPILGVWDKFDDIDFDKLPDRFLLKATHGYGCNIFISRKANLDKEQIKGMFDKWLQTDFAFNSGFELHYHNIKPRIIAEEYLENNGAALTDVKVLCFNGTPKFFTFVRGEGKAKKVECYDANWNLQPFLYTHPKNDKDLIKKPNNFSEIYEFSSKLSEGFCFVRVDFYLLDDGSIKFGELTFTPDSGIMHFKPKFCKYAKILGDLIILPKEKYDYRKIFEADEVG